MHHWSYIRRQARARLREVREHARLSTAPHLAHVDLTAAQLLDYAEVLTGLGRVPLAAGDPLLYGAQATLDDGFIYYNAEAESWLVLFYQAHEFAHHWLHQGATVCSGEAVDYTETEDKPLYGEARIEAYGPHQRREREANVFAREFLLPGDVLRRLFVGEQLNAARIAERIGVRLDFVMHALARCLLTPDIEEPHALNATSPDGTSSSVFTLDDSQRQVAESAHTPLLVAAGPGTGKTRALVGRILHLLDTGVAPSSILALTFSNKAAEELRERVQAHAPEAAPHVETHTFHSFGLELLRRYWQRAGLNPRSVVLDPVDALFILERHLPELGLDHYQNIYEPTTHLSSILAAISRAKDELCTPEGYLELAEKMRGKAIESQDKDALRKATRALEVARVYDFYQTHLERERLLDFGDLIARTVRLLRQSPETQNDVQDRYRHVLVDEYQDTNRACGLLLKLIAKDGAGLWVVGDTRQAIYRWRGAAPAQVEHFRRDFPTGRIAPLRVNYRSLPLIVEAVSTFAAKMSVAASGDEAADDANFAAWESHRQQEAQPREEVNAAGALRYEIATNGETEARHVARLIKERHTRGAPFKSNAIICRTHSQLAKFAKSLEAENVPVFYLGDIFERSEVRDLLALIALACEPSGRTLLRVARFPEYDVPLADVRALFKAARETGIEFPAALTESRAELEAVITNMTNAEGFARLATHLSRVRHIASPWQLLAHYLFIHSGYLTSLVADTTVAGAQKRLAIYQLLQFVHSQTERAVTTTRDPEARRALLAYVRRLKMFAEDKGLRQSSVAAESLDAVHLVSVHAAKGLEWDAVYLPHLGKGHFPNRRKSNPCPPPVGMIETFSAQEGAPDTHTEEEECLFFVALSRARDALFLSRAAAYGGTNSSASELLDPLEPHLPRKPDDAPTWRDQTTAAAPTPTITTTTRTSQSALPRFTERALANYIKCPRKYFYENVLYLRGKGEESAYLRFHACVYDVLRLLAADKSANRLTEIEDATRRALARLDEVWIERNLIGHLYESLYREQAWLMIERAVRRIAQARGALLEQHWTITRPRAHINVTLDHIELIEDARGATLLMQHTRTGRAPSKPPDDSLYGLYYAVASEHFPAARPQVQVLYLSTDEVIELDLKPRTVATRLGHYDEAIDSILAGEFPHTPAEHTCPRCAHLFTCPKAEETEQWIV